MKMSAEMHRHPAVDEHFRDGLAWRPAGNVGLAEEHAFGSRCAVEGVEHRVMREGKKRFAEPPGPRRYLGDPLDDERLQPQQCVPAGAGTVDEGGLAALLERSVARFEHVGIDHHQPEAGRRLDQIGSVHQRVAVSAIGG
ncbi:hypothetical protein D9M69_571430 [compost metagenome]